MQKVPVQVDENCGSTPGGAAMFTPGVRPPHDEGRVAPELLSFLVTAARGSAKAGGGGGGVGGGVPDADGVVWEALLATDELSVAKGRLEGAPLDRLPRTRQLLLNRGKTHPP